MVRHKFKQLSLVVCLFLFVLVVIGGGLHLSPAGALIAACTGTPLIVHVFNRWSRESFGNELNQPTQTVPSGHRGLKPNARGAHAFEPADAIRQ